MTNSVKAVFYTALIVLGVLLGVALALALIWHFPVIFPITAAAIVLCLIVYPIVQVVYLSVKESLDEKQALKSKEMKEDGVQK